MEKYYLCNFIKKQEINYHWFSGKSVNHTHDYFEIIIVTKGPVTHKYLDKTLELQTRDIVLVKPNIPHDPSSSIYSQHFNISFPDKICRSICNCFSSDFYDYIMRSNSDFIFTLNSTEFDYFLYKINTFFSNDPNNDNENTISNFIIQNLLNTFFLYIYLKYFSPDKRHNDNFPEWFQAFLDKISKPEIFTMKLYDIYSLSGYSQSALINYFKTYMSTTPVKHIAKLRMAYACALLQKTNQTVLSISICCGYSSLSRFITVFEHTFEKSPTEYRKLCQTLQFVDTNDKKIKREIK